MNAPSQPVIRLTQTDTELLLSVPPQHEERAKRIEGRKWDPHRVCWAYPKTPRAYEAIIAEFGDELGETVAPPHPPEPAQPVADGAIELESENLSLRHEMEQIRRTMEAMLQSGQEDAKSELVKLQRALTRREGELASVQRTLDNSEAKGEQLSTALASLKKENSRLRIELEATTSGTSTNDKLVARLFAISVQGSSDSKEFASAVQGIKSLDRYPLELAVALERTLRQRLHTDEPMSLHDLIVQAEESEILSHEAADLAHTVRKQRNITAHSAVGNDEIRARALLSLFASSLLWRDLPANLH